MLKVSDRAQVIKKHIYLSGVKLNDLLYIVYVPIYSSSVRFQQKEPKNHSNGMNKHKNIKGDET